MPVCKAAFKNTPDFEFTPSKFMNYMKYDFVNSFEDFDNGAKAYYEGNYEQTGETIARMFSKMASHKQELKTQELTGDKLHATAEVMQGFLEGAKLGKFNFTALLECIMVADKTAISAYEDVEMAMEAWKKKDFMEGVAALIMSVAIKQGVQQSVQVCSTVDKSIFDNFKPNPLGLTKKEV